MFVCKYMAEKFVDGSFYHIFNKSIANYGIFNKDIHTKRFIAAVSYCNSTNLKNSLSEYLKTNKIKSISPPIGEASQQQVVKILSYVVMPDHYHLLIRVLNYEQVPKYMSDLQNSYTRYFNIVNKRKGPLWQSRYKSVEITNDRILLHVTRYIHLNPTSSNLVKLPSDWPYSSYNQYLNPNILHNHLTEISIKNPDQYKEFVENHIDYQKHMKLLRKTRLD